MESATSLIFSLVLLFLCPSFSSDSSPDFCIRDINSSAGPNGYPCKPASTVTADDFYFSGLSVEGTPNNLTGSITITGDVFTFPALNTLGISMNRVDFVPGGINRPHIHPRATEMAVVIKGELQVGFVTTENRFFSKFVGVGDVFVYPRGLLHFQYNVGKGNASVITLFNSQFPGTIVAPLTLFGTKPEIPDEILAKSLRVDAHIIDAIKAKFQA